MKVKEIEKEWAGKYANIEVYYSPQGFQDHPSEWEAMYDRDAGYSAGRNDTVEIDDMYAKDYQIMGEEDYNDSVLCDVGTVFTDLYESGSQILVVMLTLRSYMLYMNPNVNTVEAEKAAHNGQYREFLVVRDSGRPSSSDYDEGDWDREVYDSDCDSGAYPEIDIVECPYDTMYVDRTRTILCDERALSGFTINGSEWLDNESFAEHYGSSDARVLLLFLA